MKRCKYFSNHSGPVLHTILVAAVSNIQFFFSLTINVWTAVIHVMCRFSIGWVPQYIIPVT